MQRDAGRGINYAGIGSISNPASCCVSVVSYWEPGLSESADLSQVLCGSCNSELNGLSLLSVACVGHELHARKILDIDDYE